MCIRDRESPVQSVCAHESEVGGRVTDVRVDQSRPWVRAAGRTSSEVDLEVEVMVWGCGVFGGHSLGAGAVEGASYRPCLHHGSEVDLEVSVVVGFDAWLVFEGHRLRGGPLERGPDFIDDVVCDLGGVRVLS